MVILKDKNTILFDLDGTLLPIDMDIFIKSYFKLLSGHFADIFESEYFIDVVNKATEQMIRNNGEYTNQEVFTEHFFKLLKTEGVKTSKAEIWDRFYNFYENEFFTLKKFFELDDLGYKMVEAAKEKNFNMVIATNPLFPIEAIESRLEWINLNPDDFIYITSYENMHYCKPNIGYYREILDKINGIPQDCVMIGNDMRDDMIANKIKIKTFLAEDFIVKREGIDIKPDWRGDRKQLIEHIQALEV